MSRKVGSLKLTSTAAPTHPKLPAFSGAVPSPGRRGKGKVTCHACGSSKHVRLAETTRRSYPVIGVSATTIGEPEIKVDESEMSAVDVIYELHCACGASAPYDVPQAFVDFIDPSDNCTVGV